MKDIVLGLIAALTVIAVAGVISGTVYYSNEGIRECVYRLVGEKIPTEEIKELCGIVLPE